MHCENPSNLKDFAILIIAITSLILSIISFYFTKANSWGNLEVSIKNMISNARKTINDISVLLIPYKAISGTKEYTDIKKKEFDGYSMILNSCTEDLYNSYEQACTLYLDKKLDRKRFKKSFKDEIRVLVESDSTEFSKTDSKFRAIIKVYKEWEDLEK